MRTTKSFLKYFVQIVLCWKKEVITFPTFNYFDRIAEKKSVSVFIPSCGGFHSSYSKNSFSQVSSIPTVLYCFIVVAGKRCAECKRFILSDFFLLNNLHAKVDSVPLSRTPPKAEHKNPISQLIHSILK